MYYHHVLLGKPKPSVTALSDGAAIIFDDTPGTSRQALNIAENIIVESEKVEEHSLPTAGPKDVLPIEGWLIKIVSM